MLKAHAFYVLFKPSIVCEQKVVCVEDTVSQCCRVFSFSYRRYDPFPPGSAGRGGGARGCGGGGGEDGLT